LGEVVVDGEAVEVAVEVEGGSVVGDDFAVVAVVVPGSAGVALFAFVLTARRAARLDVFSVFVVGAA
jgi:hypothetical protein